jgi:hypothetical protein
MKIKIGMFFLLVFVIASGSALAEIQTTQAFERMCCQLTDGSCGNALPDATTCILGTAVECASCSAAGDTTVTGALVATKFTNPLDFDTVEEFLGGILSAIQGIIVVLALVFILIGAVMILVSAGNSGMVEKGKAAITMALLGLAIGVAAPSLLKQLSIIIGWGPGAAGAGLTLSEIAMRVLNFLLGTMGILALIMLVIGGIMYLTSAGDEDRIDKGKEIFKYSLIGVVMAMSAMVLVTQIAKFFQ